MTLDQAFGLVLIAGGVFLLVVAARYDRPILGFGLVESLLKRLPPRGQKAYTVGLAVFVIVLGVVALID